MGGGGGGRHACPGEPEAQFPSVREQPLPWPQHATSLTSAPF
jgi:hypothetical protein